VRQVGSTSSQANKKLPHCCSGVIPARDDFDTENGARCCRRSFVGSTFGPFTCPPTRILGRWHCGERH